MTDPHFSGMQGSCLDTLGVFDRLDSEMEMHIWVLYVLGAPTDSPLVNRASHSRSSRYKYHYISWRD